MGKDFIMSIYKGTQLISGVATPIEPTKCIGQIVYAILPLVDSGLHLLDGEVISGNGIYKAFVEYISKLDLSASYFTTEAEWQATVEQYGVCGKFVYNASAKTVRLPKVTGHVEGTLDPNALGDLVEAGLPNITGSVTGIANTSANVENGALTLTRTAQCSVAGSTAHHQSTIFLNASNGNPIYKDGVNTVQTQSILGFMYIVVATGTKTDIEVDIDNFVTDLNQKVDKSSLVEVPIMTMPDYSAIITGVTTPYTAPCNGFILWNNAGTVSCTVNGITVPVGGNDASNEGSVTLPLNEGDMITFSQDVGTPCFIPMKGVI
jgi:hypothetical protein